MIEIMKISISYDVRMTNLWSAGLTGRASGSIPGQILIIGDVSSEPCTR